MKKTDNRLEELLPEDRELKSLLESWPAPAALPSLDRRVMAAYREQTAAASATKLSLWKRIFAVSVPVPVAAAAMVLLMGAAWMAGRARGTVTINLPAPDAQTERVIEVPVERERIVTRTMPVNVCRHRKEQPPQPLTEKLAAEKKQPRTLLQSSGEDQIYFTRADLAGFEPVAEVQIRITKGGQTNEK